MEIWPVYTVQFIADGKISESSEQSSNMISLPDLSVENGRRIKGRSKETS